MKVCHAPSSCDTSVMLLSEPDNMIFLFFFFFSENACMQEWGRAGLAYWIAGECSVAGT